MGGLIILEKEVAIRFNVGQLGIQLVRKYDFTVTVFFTLNILYYFKCGFKIIATQTLLQVFMILNGPI